MGSLGWDPNSIRLYSYKKRQGSDYPPKKKKRKDGDFPDGPVAKNPLSNAGHTGSNLCVKLRAHMQWAN